MLWVFRNHSITTVTVRSTELTVGLRVYHPQVRVHSSDAPSLDKCRKSIKLLRIRLELSWNPLLYRKSAVYAKFSAWGFRRAISNRCTVGLAKWWVNQQFSQTLLSICHWTVTHFYQQSQHNHVAAIPIERRTVMASLNRWYNIDCRFARPNIK